MTTLTTSRNYIRTTSVASLLLPSLSHHWSFLHSVICTNSFSFVSKWHNKKLQNIKLRRCCIPVHLVQFSNTKASICKWCGVRLTCNSWISERPCLLWRSLGDWKATGAWSEKQYKEIQRVYRCLQRCLQMFTLREKCERWDDSSAILTTFVASSFGTQVFRSRCACHMLSEDDNLGWLMELMGLCHTIGYASQWYNIFCGCNGGCGCRTRCRTHLECIDWSVYIVYIVYMWELLQVGKFLNEFQKPPRLTSSNGFI